MTDDAMLGQVRRASGAGFVVVPVYLQRLTFDDASDRPPIHDISAVAFADCRAEDEAFPDAVQL